MILLDNEKALVQWGLLRHGIKRKYSWRFRQIIQGIVSYSYGGS
jgi:hypothetical protein